MITDSDKIHLLAATQWLTRYEQHKDDAVRISPGLHQANQVIGNLLPLVNRLCLDIELMESINRVKEALQ